MENLTPQIQGAIVGGVISTIAAIVILLFTNRGHNTRQKKQHKHELMLNERDNTRIKLEEIFLSYSLWETNFMSIYLSLIGYVKGELSETEAFQVVNKQDRGGGGHKEKVEMLLHLYFQSLLPEYEKVMAQRAKVVLFFPPHNNSQFILQDYFSSQKVFEAYSENFKDAIVRQIKSYNHVVQ